MGPGKEGLNVEPPTNSATGQGRTDLGVPGFSGLAGRQEKEENKIPMGPRTT